MKLVLLLFPVIAAAGWERLLRRASPDRMLRLLLAWICTLMQLSSGLALLGFLGFLRPGVAIGLEVLITAAVFAGGWRQGDAPGRLASSTEPAVVRAPTPRRGTWLDADRLALLVVAALCVPILLRLVLYVSVVEPSTMDGLAYHLPPLVEALQRGRFVVSDTLNVWANAYPKNAEMIYLWLMLGRTGGLILFGQALFLPLGILGVALLTRRFGISKPLALAAGLCILFVPIVVTQSAAEYIDIAMGCTLLACAALTLTYRDGQLARPWGTIVLLAALGFLAGIKYNGPLIAGVFGVAAILPDVWRRKLGWEHLIGMLAALPGVLWYFANIAWFRNPLWPFAIPGLSHLAPYTAHVADIMLPNTPPEFRHQSPWLSTWQVWREQYPKAELYSIDSRFGGLGPLWFVLWLPAIPFWLYRELRAGRALKAAGFAALFCALFATMEAFWWTRYTWWIVALGIVAFAALWRQMPHLLRAATGIAVVAGALFVLWNTTGAMAGKPPLRFVGGSDPISVVRQRHGEVIAVSRMPWQQYYLYGDDYSNRLVMLSPVSSDGPVAQMRQAGATLYFAPDTSDPVLPLAQPCLQEVTRYGTTGPRLFTFTCR